jgi:hypothetical protein
MGLGMLDRTVRVKAQCSRGSPENDGLNIADHATHSFAERRHRLGMFDDDLANHGIRMDL